MSLPKFLTIPSRCQIFYILSIILGIFQLLLLCTELWGAVTTYSKWVDSSKPYTFWIFVYELYLSIYHGTFYVSFLATNVPSNNLQSRQEAVDRMIHNLSHLGAFKSKKNFDFYVAEFIGAVLKPGIIRKWGSWSMYSEGRALATLVYPLGVFIAYFGALVLIQEDGCHVVLKVLAWLLMGVLASSLLVSLEIASDVGWISGMRDLVYFVNRDVNSAVKLKGVEAGAEELQGWVDELADKFMSKEAERDIIVEKQVLNV